jgi:hypothetical protein
MLQKSDISDTELSFRALYATILYRIKGDEQKAQAIGDVQELVSPVIALLADMYGKVERGEVDLFDDKQ